MQFEKALEQLRIGRITFGEFIALTQTRWEALAALISRRWKMPGWVTRQDIEQELHAGVSEFVWKWSPVYGVTLSRYVTFNAMDKAKKRVHKLRGADYTGRGIDFNPSRYETPISSFATRDGGEESKLLEKLVTEPEQYERVMRREAIDRALAACENERELLTVQALAETQSIALAAELLYEDKEARLRCRFSCEKHARKVVERAAESVARKLGN